MKLYSVEFTINNDYRVTTETFRTISLTVHASDQFDALRCAWLKLSDLYLDEPKAFTASRVEACK